MEVLKFIDITIKKCKAIATFHTILHSIDLSVPAIEEKEQ